MPDPETSLLADVAQRTADFYNECGFDMIYLDALDGEDILGGGENAWHYGSQFVFEIVKRLKKPALMVIDSLRHHVSRLTPRLSPTERHDTFPAWFWISPR